jgi:hypothetical protein
MSKCHHQGILYEHAEMVPNVVESREGWELFIVTDGVIVGILPSTQLVQIGLHDDGVLKYRNM